MRVRLRIRPTAFGNALGSSLAAQIRSESGITIGGRNEHGMGLRQGGGFNLSGVQTYESSTVSYATSDTVDSAWTAGASAGAVDDLPDVRIGEPYPASGVTQYEGNSVRYKTVIGGENNSWSIVTDDGRDMPIRMRTWGPSGQRMFWTQGPTDEMPQPHFYYPGQGTGGIPEPAGPSFVAVDEVAEARAEAQRQRAATSIGILAGGVLTSWAGVAQQLGAPNDVVNNIGMSQAGLVGSYAGGAGSPIYVGPRSYPARASTFMPPRISYAPRTNWQPASGYSQPNVSPTTVSYNINSGQPTAGVRSSTSPVNGKPQWLQNIEAGNAFNSLRAPNYPYNEVYVNKPSGSGYYRLDSFNPTAGEIVSRKFTQFSAIQESTGIGYVNEIVNKYPVGATVASVPSSGGLAGTTLHGQYILEVPVQTRPIPQTVLDAANNAGVLIRDINGYIY